MSHMREDRIGASLRSGVMLWVSGLVALLGGVPQVAAQQGGAGSPDEQLWSRTFGEGMRAWAESDYEVALEKLYQSYALKPTAYNLGLIIRSHDFLGQCHAAHNQRKEYAALYGERDRPVLQSCAVVSKLKVTCPEGYARLAVWLNGSKAGLCDEALVASARGEVEVSVPEVQYVARVNLGESEEVVHQVELKAQEKRPHVSKLLGTADRYTVFMTPDGLYQIWVLSDEALLEPYEGSFCMRQEGAGKGSDSGKASCKPLTKKQRDELEKVAPRVLLLPE